MHVLRGVSRLFFATVSILVVGMAATASPAWAGGPDGVVENDDISRAVGSGVLDGALVGFMAVGSTNKGAAAAVVAACQNAGGEQCSSDEVTNDVFCVVSLGAMDGSGVVAGGAGTTLEEAREDAVRNVGRADLVADPGARVLASSCP